MKIKRFLTMLLACLLALSLVACNGDDPTVTDTETTSEESSEESTNPPSTDKKNSHPNL